MLQDREALTCSDEEVNAAQIRFICEGGCVKVKDTGAKKAQNSLFLQCKTLISNKFGFIEDRALKFACRLWCIDICRMNGSDLTKYTHLRVVSLRLKGNLV